LARIEVEIMIGTLLERCDDLALAIEPSDLSWQRSPGMRILDRLPVTFTPVRENTASAS
jgi:cytochrome P450